MLTYPSLLRPAGYETAVVGKWHVHSLRPDHPTGSVDITGMTEKEATQDAYQKYLKDYLRTVKSMDGNIGRLLTRPAV